MKQSVPPTNGSKIAYEKANMTVQFYIKRPKDLDKYYPKGYMFSIFHKQSVFWETSFKDFI